MVPDRWYPILESARLRSRPVGVTRLGRRLVLWRDGAGWPVVLPALCPHRGADLAGGRVRGGELVCPWHGFRFAADGRCTRVPCAGPEARVPRALDAQALPCREGQGLIWVWHGAPRAALPALPGLLAELGTDLRATAQASYELPCHYSRMVETNLDVHHTPFVHGSVLPVGERVDDFDAHLEGDRIRTRGVLRREDGGRRFAFRADAELPGLGTIALGTRLAIAIASTPVDAQRSWVWFRYHQNVTRHPLLGRLVAWLAVQSELRIVQRQDWRIFRSMAPGTIDEVDAHFVAADAGIALYRKRRRELLERACPGAASAGGA